MGNEAAPGILVVDDEEYICRMVSRLLQAKGYLSAKASSGTEALGILDSGNFELLISDIMMPGMSGMELLSKAKKLYPDLAVIMLTAVDNQETAIDTLELGAYGYVIKPFHSNELLINVANALRRRQLEKMRDEYESRLTFEVRERTREIRKTQEEVIYRLVSASEFRSMETGAHIRRMAQYSTIVARSLGWDFGESEDLGLAASMHDIGKIGVPDEILMKPGKYTPEEFERMKEHTTIGASILEGSDIPLIVKAREIALYHHEKWDGSGYPMGLAGEAIPVAARIAAVCDVYDALVSDRVYRPALDEEAALSIMKEGRGRHFDPKVLDCFMECLPELHRIKSEMESSKDRPEMNLRVAALMSKLPGEME
jgi:putative two-component system response regulator